MDPRELIKRLQPFLKACKAKGYEFSQVYLRENMEGFPPAGYHLYFKADWIQPQNDCDGLIDDLIDIYGETIKDPEVKRKIHYFTVIDESEKPSYWDYPLVYEGKKETI